ncbi:copper resistance CopC family protein [Streptomyces sp. NPDC101062]|uniref:copper resistance CopC family protein n=1 Tax=unclassified Streptomyces TaxID=2593676 RepID=UPI0037FDFAAF
MPVIHWRAARVAVRTLGIPVVAAGVLAVAAPRAAAHTELVSSSPASAATLGRPPERVTLTFSDEMTRKYAKVSVTASGTTSDGSASDTPQVSGRVVSLALRPGAPGGRYTVGYRVVSADGHPVSGSYTFTVEAAGTPTASAPATEPSVAPSLSATAASRPGGTHFSPNAPVAAGVGALVVVGAGAYIVHRKRAGHGG